MKGQLGNLMKQAQKMQEEAERAQSEIAQMEVEGEAGGGLVKVVMTGSHEVKVIVEEIRAKPYQGLIVRTPDIF